MNIKAVLDSVGSSLDKVLSLKIYLTNMKDLEYVDRIWGRCLRAPYPASTCVQVSLNVLRGIPRC
jgi:2-iminobutanoate/2-iminopropanoate deaminase